MTTDETQRDHPNQRPAAERCETWAELNARALGGDEDAIDALLATTGLPRRAWRTAAEQEQHGA